MRIPTATLGVASLILITAVTAPVAQAAPTQVNVRIEGRSETLFEGPILTEGHEIEASSDTQERPCDGINPNDPENTTPGPTPTAASVDAMSLIGETFDGRWYGGYDDYFITRWGADQEAEGKSWGILVNNVYTNVGGCQYELSAGDEVLWIFNAFESKPILGLFAVNEDYTSGERPLTATAQLDKPFEVEVAAYDDHAEAQPPASPERTSANTEPYQGADVSPMSISEKGFETVETASPETVTTNNEGKASITFITPGWHRIKAGTVLNAKGEEKAIRSNRLDVCVPAAGQANCGEPPAEDRVRALSRYLTKAKEETHETTGTGGNNPGGEQPGTGAGPAGDQPGGSGADTPPPATSTQTPTHTASGPVAGLAVESIGPARLLLKLTAPGVATVKIAQLRGKGHPRHLQIAKTITVKAGKAGALEVKLPRLAAGSYRVTISLAGAKTVVETLTVPHRRQ